MIEQPIENTYEAQQQNCEKKSQYWGCLEDDVNHRICPEFANMSEIT